jgi:hypothetical protein
LFAEALGLRLRRGGHSRSWVRKNRKLLTLVKRLGVGGRQITPSVPIKRGSRSLSYFSLSLAE